MPFQKDEENLIDVERAKVLLHEKDSETLLEFISPSHPADVARLLTSLSNEEARQLFYLLDSKTASEVVVELSDESVEHILDEMESKRVGEIVEHMASDDAADLIGVLSDDDANEVLQHISEEDTRQVKKLLAYEEDSAGGIMQAEVASVSSDATIRVVISMLRKLKDEYENIHNVFITDSLQVLIGVLPIRKLVLESPETVIADIMETEFVDAHVDQDQEEVARIFKKYDLISLPVTDDDGLLVGRITIDDVVDIIEEEASEDILKMAGAGSEDILSMSTLRSAKTRLPWLFASCMGGIVALNIIGAFESSLGRMVVLASFIPVILGMGGNIGTQSTTIVVRGMAIGSININNLWKIVYKEIKVGFILGSIYGVLLAVATAFIYSNNPNLSIVVGVSMFASMIIATTVGTMMPIVLFRMGVDPAVATGPFVTTSIDIIAILILFNFAAVFLF